jgi:hypothetical protein
MPFFVKGVSTPLNFKTKGQLLIPDCEQSQAQKAASSQHQVISTRCSETQVAAKP